MDPESDRSGDTGSAAQIQQALAKVLRWTSRRDNRERLYGSAELSQNDVWLLDAVQSAGEIRLSDLAAWQGVDKSTITPQVRRLEDRGLVRRSPDAGDRRAVLLVVTPQGRRLQQRRAEAGADLIEVLLQAWPAEERSAFATYFDRFADHLGGGSPP
jgi:DNA-binding MarR family transcriptional regulator